MGEIYGRMTGRKRLIIVLGGALSGTVVAALFALFSRQPLTPIDLVVGALIGGLLGLSASLGEVRRKRQ